MTDVIQVLLNSLSEFIGGLSAAIVIALAAIFRKRLGLAALYRKYMGRGAESPAPRALPEPPGPTQDMQSLVTGLLPADLLPMFNYSELACWTEDDTAGLSLIAEMIEKKAEREIRVIGRGTQLVDAKTGHYVRAVANALLRGVEYQRILIQDPALPQNSLLWLLLLERFLASARWREKVCLHVIEMHSTNTHPTNIVAQFQVVDGRFLHSVTRYYSEPDSGASQQAQSFFALSPHPEVSQHVSKHKAHLARAGNRYKHRDVADLLATMLHNLDASRQDISYHWKLVLDVAEFLEHLNIPNIPPRGIKFIGCLMPFTFTYDAAERFVRSSNEDASRERVVSLPFRRMEDAIRQFIGGRLDYVCVPVENSRVDHLVPPTADAALLELLRNDSHKLCEVELPVKFVLAGVYQKPTKWRRLVAVEAAHLQVRNRLPRAAARLTRWEDEVESNYHAAWLARNDPALAAITTPAAARYFHLYVYSDLQSAAESNTTKFAVYTRPGRRVLPA